MSLEPTTFVAGELDIIMSRRIEVSEKVGKLKLLKKLMYLASIHEWQALLKFYAAWVRRIEIGLSTSADDSVEIEKCWKDFLSRARAPQERIT